MTCGNNLSVQPIVELRAPAANWQWLARLSAELHAWFDRTQRRQFLIEVQKARQRGLLLDLDDRLLKDIGMTREVARREARKPFWHYLVRHRAWHPSEKRTNLPARGRTCPASTKADPSYR